MCNIDLPPIIFFTLGIWFLPVVSEAAWWTRVQRGSTTASIPWSSLLSAPVVSVFSVDIRGASKSIAELPETRTQDGELTARQKVSRVSSQRLKSQLCFHENHSVLLNDEQTERFQQT